MTPLLADVDPHHRAMCPLAEERLLLRHGDRIAAIVPCAAFGYPIDLDCYRWPARRHGVAMVVQHLMHGRPIPIGRRDRGAEGGSCRPPCSRG